MFTKKNTSHATTEGFIVLWGSCSPNIRLFLTYPEAMKFASEICQETKWVVNVFQGEDEIASLYTDDDNGKIKVSMTIDLNVVTPKYIGELS